MDDVNKLPEDSTEKEAVAAEPVETKEPDNEKEPKNIKEPKKVKLTSVIIVAFMVFYVLGMSVFILSRTGYVRIGKDKTNDDVNYARLKEVHELLKANYVGELDEETMMLNALAVYTASVGDPYTQYLPKETADGYIDGNYQSQTGIGIRASYSDDPVGVYVGYVYPNSPANKAGLEKGDVITAVDGFIVTEDNFETAMDKIPGEEGSSVRLTVARDGEAKIFMVVRGSFTVDSVEYMMLKTAPDIGYIRIDGVAQKTADEFKNAVTVLQKQGAKKYIFDVRDDGGGYLEAVTKILDMLLPEGPIVRWTLADGTESSNQSDSEQLIKAPFAVLINGRTASAAELFAAALRDYELATLVGETTYGKGVMQTLFPLKNGDTLKITTAYYHPPFGENYNEIGVKPDIEVSLPEGEDYATVTEEEDTQIQAAIKALNNTSAQD